MKPTLRAVPPAPPSDSFFAGVPDEDEVREPASGAHAVPKKSSPLPSSDAPRVWTATDVIETWGTEGPLVHEPAGIAKLDELTGGGPVYGSRWYVLGAPDAGKTALLSQIADTYARRGVAVGILTVDEEPGDLVTRLAQRAGYSRVECEQRQPDVLEPMAAALADLPIRIYGADHTIESAATDLAEFAKGFGGRGALFVDSIQTVSCGAVLAGRGELSPREVVTLNVKALRSAATYFRLIGMATGEMNRGAYRSADAAERSSDMASGKESGAIEYSARVMLAMRSVPGDGDLLEVRIAKNKHGPSGDVIHLAIDRRRMRLSEAEAPERPDAEGVRSEQGHVRVVADAARVLLAVFDHPGIGVSKLHARMRALHGSFSEPRCYAGMERLGRGLARLSGPRCGVRLYVQGDKVPADVLAALPLDKRPAVAVAVAPEVVE